MGRHVEKLNPWLGLLALFLSGPLSSIPQPVFDTACLIGALVTAPLLLAVMAFSVQDLLSARMARARAFMSAHYRWPDIESMWSFTIRALMVWAVAALWSACGGEHRVIPVTAGAVALLAVRRHIALYLNFCRLCGGEQ